MTDPIWHDANLVYIPYCSSDAHMGDSDHEVGATNLHHMNIFSL